ncbi:unnamed protein product [Rodentolepis nana]|uniref:DNA ligase 1 n=1 Tax=Rodentolepis nana TaxID=102285 RepID=A0A0R3TLC5_RODNA|nr:unnamed protein product [Rodentolepis nana]
MPQKSLLSSPPSSHNKENRKRRVFLETPQKSLTSKVGESVSGPFPQLSQDSSNNESVLSTKDEAVSSGDESQSPEPNEPTHKKVVTEPSPPPVKKRKTLQSVKTKSESSVSKEPPSVHISSVSENPSKGRDVSHSKIDDFDPSKDSYDPIKDSCWGLNEPVPYIAFAKTLERVEGISSRLKIIEVLANFYRSVGVLSPKELPNCINLSINRLGPSYEGLELGIGESLLIKALTLTTGASNDRIKSELNRLGDLGAVAESVRSRQQTMFKPKSLTLQVVYDRLKEISLMVGNASQTKKVKLIQTLLVACRECEAKYLIRSLQGKLRIGLAEQSVLAALGQAVAMTPFHSVRVSNNDRCMISQLLTFLLYRLLGATRYVTNSLFKINNKARFPSKHSSSPFPFQIHLLPDGSVRVYSRNQEDNTSKYPDIVNSLVACVVEAATLSSDARKLLLSIADEDAKLPMKGEGEENEPVTSFIIDSEAVAWDVDAQQILPFQVLSTRKRKDVQEEDVKVRVCIFAFDLLFLNGVSLTEQPLRKRRELLWMVFPTLPGRFVFATSMDSSDTDEISRFMSESVKGNCEGLMVKTLDKGATYEIAKRSRNWLKLKKDYLEGVGDTLDLVVIGGFHGTGKRTGRYGGFLLACYNPDDEEYQTICKVGTGLKDEDLANLSDFLKDHIIPSAKTYYQYDKSLQPDHWFEPVQVWEVKAADISISPAHKAAAGMADPEKGLSLRFPRFLRVREDKKPEDATTTTQVYEMYCNQEQVKNADKQPADEEDFY